MFKDCYYKDLQYFLETFASSSIFVCTNLLQTWERACDYSFVNFKSGTFIILFILKNQLLEKENALFISL